MNSKWLTTTIKVNPSFDAFFYSFYLKGVYDSFPHARIEFDHRSFPQTEKFAFILGTPPVRVFIDGRDRANLDETALDWCHVYGKVNLDNHEYSLEQSKKIVAIGPSFGIRLFGPVQTPLMSLDSYLHFGSSLRHSRDMREHFANYWRQYRYRLPESAYASHTSSSDYVFSISSLWADDDRCNQHRATFYSVCKSLKCLTFEGGFAPRSDSFVGRYCDLVTTRRYPIAEYLTRLTRSAVAFNTPAVFDCHGWKLGEFLALGKAIISTPLSRRMPAPLRHGREVHFVDGSEKQVREAVVRILKDDEYRRCLEKNARAYWTRYLRPSVVIERLVLAASTSLSFPPIIGVHNTHEMEQFHNT